MLLRAIGRTANARESTMFCPADQFANSLKYIPSSEEADVRTWLATCRVKH